MQERAINHEREKNKKEEHKKKLMQGTWRTLADAHVQVESTNWEDQS